MRYKAESGSYLRPQIGSACCAPGVLVFCVIVGLTRPSLPAAGEQKRKHDEARTDRFKQWLNGDVVYIITPEERAVFEKLSTDDERERFIEQFWKRRDPNSLSEANEFKEEHYRRIAYANAHFASGVEGWATDRGRIYIVFGPPTNIESHPSGGHYGRDLREGGGFTEAYPFERWYYRDLPGVGSGIEMEFVDPSLSGEYRLALSGTEKDALLFIPESGPTLFERAGLESRAGRILESLMGRSVGLSEYSARTSQTNPFARIQQYFALRRPPQLQYKDLTGLVTTRVAFVRPLPFTQQVDTFRVTKDQVVASLTLKIPQQELAYKKVDNMYRPSVQIYGRVENINKDIVYEFEDIISSVFLVDPSTIHEASVLYQKKLPLRSGRFKLSLVVKDQASARAGVRESLIHAPEYPERTLKASNIVLTKTVTTAGDETVVDPFVTQAGVKVYPEDTFEQGDRIACYLEIYGAGIDPSTHQPDIQLDYRLVQIEGREERVLTMREPAVVLRDDSVFLLGFLPPGLPAGRFRIEFQAQDRINTRSLSIAREFAVQ